MRSATRFAVVVAALAAAAATPATAGALDSADSISLVAPQGHVYVNEPFSFTGAGTVDGGDLDYEEGVLFVPASSPNMATACPQDAQTAVQEIDTAYGPDADGSLSAVGVGTAIGDEAGPYTYSATVNSGIVAQVSSPGTFHACAYLADGLSGTTLAVSPAPVPFTVTDPPGVGKPPEGFGGPRGHTGHPADETLSVTGPRTIDAPGRNLLHIRGLYSVTSGLAGLAVTLNRTSHYDGCAANDEEEGQITRADGGAVLALAETVTPNTAGVFDSPLALPFKRRVRGTLVLCAYLVQSGDDLAVGAKRFTTHVPARRHG